MKVSSKGLTNKVLTVVIVSYLSLISFVTFSIYNNYLENSRRFIFNKLQAIAQTTVSLLDPTDIAYLINSYKKKDEILKNADDLVYYRVNKILSDIALKNNLTTPIYIMELVNNEHFEFISTSSENPYFRHQYFKFPKHTIKNYEVGGTVGPYYSEKGNWLSAFYPIRDFSGKTLAILQVDQEFTEVKNAAKTEFYTFLFWGILITAIFLVIIIPMLTKMTSNAEKNEVKLSQTLEVISKKNHELSEAKLQIDKFNAELLNLNEKLEKIVEDRTQNLVKTNKELDHFVYSASHNLRSPLTTLMGLIELSHTESNNTVIKKYLTLMDTTIKKLDFVIRDIIDYSKNNRIEIKGEWINVPQLVREEFDNNLTKKANFDCRLILEIENTLNQEPIFFTDKIRLKILLRNLFSNAIIHQPEKTECAVIVHLTFNPKELIMAVTDRGIGIPDEIIPKIYNLFFVGNPLSNGSGIGLYIVKEVVSKLGGKIELKTKVNEGSTFKVFIPAIVH